MITVRRDAEIFDTRSWLLALQRKR